MAANPWLVAGFKIQTLNLFSQENTDFTPPSINFIWLQRRTGEAKLEKQSGNDTGTPGYCACVTSFYKCNNRVFTFRLQTAPNNPILETETVFSRPIPHLLQFQSPM